MVSLAYIVDIRVNIVDIVDIRLILSTFSVEDTYFLLLLFLFGLVTIVDIYLNTIVDI